MLYVDSSVMVKLYVPEPQSELISSFVSTLDEPLVYTSLHALEIKNALAQKTFRAEMPVENVHQIYKDLDTDFDNEVLIRPDMDWPSLFAESVRISGMYTHITGARSLDILHVAAAIVLGCRDFLTFDTRQHMIAQKALLHVIELQKK